MPTLHKNITASADIHNPKWFPDANNGDVAWRNEKGELESTDELVLPAALNFVDASVAPPTTNDGDIYVLSSGGSVNAGWGAVSLDDWVRYDLANTTWNSITPNKSVVCYDKTADVLMSYDGADWLQVGSDSIYTASGTVPSSVVATLTDTLTFKGADLLGTSSNIKIVDSASADLWDFRNNGDVYLGQSSNIYSTNEVILNFESSALNPYININASTTTNNSSLLFQRLSVDKWLIGNDGSSDTFRVRNLINPSNPITVSSTGVINLHECSTTPADVNIGGNLFIDGSQVPATFKGTSNMYLEIDNTSTSLNASIGFSANGTLSYLIGYDGQKSGGFSIRPTGGDRPFHILPTTSNIILKGGTTPALIGSEKISLQDDTLMGITGSKIGFMGTAPIVQVTTGVTAATFTANTSGIANDTATFDGYTIGQIVKALRNYGLLA